MVHTSPSVDKPEQPRLMLSQSTSESSASESSTFEETRTLETKNPITDAPKHARIISVDSSFSGTGGEEVSLLGLSATSATGAHPTTVMRLKQHDSAPPRAERWMQEAWIAHFLIGATVLLFSVFVGNGGTRKYIAVDPSHAIAINSADFLECDKLLINVLAESAKDDGAIVCCGSNRQSNQSASLLSTILDLCPPPRLDATQQQSLSAGSFITFLPFLGRLAKFPDAWLIPLFPLLLRIGFRTYQTIVEKGHIVLDTTFGVFSFRRLVFYFLLMQFRGWVLYVALNNLEDNFIVDSKDMETAGALSASCWYKQWLPVSTRECQGRVFDFSDHVVLYYAQILPIALLEYLHSMDRPYWPFHFFRRIALPFLLTSGMLYLYFITFVGVYKTCAYFHTPKESLAGYAVSLVAHLPLCTLQCSNGFTTIAHLREYFFGPTKRSKKLLR